ncbi:RidA family protein [uncultured Roseobacter sp.]|uniref:RidA family protein n=1 Tax=uncultured Roseobacter sp. TaxID=114847 RepID=UPI002636F5B8|nr:RidA family protein [uncultured Roseobacter sp.]
MLTRLSPSTVRPVPPQFAGIYTHGTRLEAPSRLIALSGQIGIPLEGPTPPDFAGQCHQAMDHVEALLNASDMGLADILRVTYYLTRPDDLPELSAIRQSRWRTDTPPAVTTLVVAGLASPELLVEIEVLAGV